MTSFAKRAAATTVVLLSLTANASAHTGVGDAHGFVHGFMHPVGGLDHVLAMVAVGLYAALLGGRALWLVPASFVGVMAIGGALGIAGINVPYVEIGIALSIVVLGLAVALRLSVPTLAAMGLVGFFAIFHGHAHGAEMPQDASGYAYAAGFMLATALLHAAGVSLGLIAGRLTALGGARLTQAAGGAMALAGIVILVRAF
jgi:urease accessory protein